MDEEEEDMLLPDEIWLRILGWMDPGPSWMAARLTCKKWAYMIGGAAHARIVFGRIFGIANKTEPPFKRGEEDDLFLSGVAEALERRSVQYEEAIGSGNYPWLLKHHWALPQLSGVWRGKYGPHGWELLHVQQGRGFLLWATKLTGDPNVPAGAETWRVQMDCGFRVGVGRIQLADHGYRNPRFGLANVLVQSPSKLVVYWLLDREEAIMVPTECFRLRASVSEVISLIQGMEKDQWGNVNANLIDIE